jgi:cysteine desulfurase
VTRDHTFADRPSSRATSRAGGARTTADRVRRTLSQNFLVDRHAIDLVIKAAAPAGLLLVSVMAVDNETGALQPIAEPADLAHRSGALFHCDAAQAAGRIPLDVEGLGVDLLTVVGHKMYAPKIAAAVLACLRKRTSGSIATTHVTVAG